MTGARRKVKKSKSRSSIKYAYADWKPMALMRYEDVIKFLELQKDANGEIVQYARIELCCFWALVFARQAGLVTTYEEFKAKAEELINFCGSRFARKCHIGVFKTAFTKYYWATTSHLIKSLRITPEYQEHMKVLRYNERVSVKKHQPRAEWLAEHSQEREKPWKKLGISRTVYFILKKDNTLKAFEEALERALEKHTLGNN